MNSWKKLSVFATPIGATLAAVCFFLPWVEVSCGPMTVRGSGVGIGGIFWVVFALAVIILVSFFYFWVRRQQHISRSITLICSICALGIIVYKFSDTFIGGKVSIKASDVGSIFKPGAFGVIIGFVLAVIGAAYSNIPSTARGRERAAKAVESNDPAA